MKKVEDLLAEKIEMFKEKGKEYGHSYKEFGPVMQKFFPKVEMSIEEWNRCGIFFMLIHKMMRLANSDIKHIDSIKDIQVYGAMLEEMVLEEGNENDCSGL